MNAVNSLVRPSIPPIGILLVYYEEYKISSLKAFQKLMLDLDCRSVIVVVCNDAESDFKDIRGVYPIRGDNSLREFSGWDAGLTYARKIGLLVSHCSVVFANDTFCHHNKFGFISRYCFRLAFAKLLRNQTQPSISGEVWRQDEAYSVGGYFAEEWVATYLFMVSGELMERIFLVSPAMPMSRFYEPSDTELRFSNLLSDNLAQHITSWLCGDSSARWRNFAGADAQLLVSLKGKANSIIAEKYLTARAISMGASVNNVFGNPILQRLRRLESIPERVRRLLAKFG